MTLWLYFIGHSWDEGPVSDFSRQSLTFFGTWKERSYTFMHCAGTTEVTVCGSRYTDRSIMGGR